MERIYVIPLREKCRPVPRYKKTPKAIKSIKEFLARHMKVRDRDLNKIRIDKYLNQFMWGRGIKNPPHKVKIKAYQDGENIRVELVDFPEKLKFQKLKEEKRESKAQEIGSKKKIKTEESEKKEEIIEEKKIEESEKKSAVVEAGEKMEKATAQKVKHESKAILKRPQTQPRKILGK